MIVLLTDFGIGSPYMAQLHAVLHQRVPEVPVIDLHADLHPFHIKGAAYLLPAYAPYFPAGSVFICVIDPGVGSQRRPLAVRAGGHWWVGPDNGLLSILTQHYADAECWEIRWQPNQLSNSFHARDVFTPMAARLHQGDHEGLRPITDMQQLEAWGADAAEIIYADYYGNLFTGLRASYLQKDYVLSFYGQALHYAPSFYAVPIGQAFWYYNSIDLVEIAINQGNAQHFFNAQIGDIVDLSGHLTKS